jgi:DNA-binding response OmpR family regulator
MIARRPGRLPPGKTVALFAAVAAVSVIALVGARVEVTALEFRLLSAFIRRRGRVLSRQQLIDAAWGPDTSITDRVVDTHVLNLRKKIEPLPARPRFLTSVRGMGYRFDG